MPGVERPIPALRTEPVQITGDMNFPETDSGYWRVNFLKNYEDFGPRPFQGDYFSLHVPSPHGWFSEWNVNNQGMASAIYAEVLERPRLPSSRRAKLKGVRWILSKNFDNWVPANEATKRRMQYRAAWNLLKKVESGAVV